MGKQKFIWRGVFFRLHPGAVFAATRQVGALNLKLFFTGLVS
jgi:hypothetical protein